MPPDTGGAASTMMGMRTRIPTSLKWLASKRARLASEITQLKSRLKAVPAEISAIEAALETLKADVRALDRVIAFHNIPIDPNAIPDIRSSRKTHSFAYGHHTRLIQTYLRTRKGNWNSTTEIASFVWLKSGIEGEMSGEFRTKMRHTLKRLAQAGRLYPEFPAWERAYLWQLANPKLPRLEQLRLVIASMLSQLGIYTPSPEEYEAYFPAEDTAVLEGLSDQQWCERYAVSMQPIIEIVTPTSLSLLAALATESFIVDNEMLLQIHREGFWRSAQQIISDPSMADIQTDFEAIVMARILLGSWSLPAAFHVSSIKAPFVHMADWKKITGIDQWVSICESR